MPRNGNHLAAIESGMFPRVMLFRISEYRTSTAVWTLFGRAFIRPAIHTIVKIVSNVARNRYSTARLMLNTPRLTQLTSLNSFWIWNTLFLCWVKP